jgi:hypothetical protein
MIGATFHMEKAFIAHNILAPDRSFTSAKMARFRRSAASSTTKAGEGTR